MRLYNSVVITHHGPVGYVSVYPGAVSHSTIVNPEDTQWANNSVIQGNCTYLTN